MVAADSTQILVRDRKHSIILDRMAQMSFNLLAWKGGKPYITTRLTRWPGEDDTSWLGDATKQIIGRRDRGFLVNYAQRIVQKINQLVFTQTVERKGADAAFLLDVTMTGQSVNQVMMNASSMMTAAGWCWLSVDAGRIPVDPGTGQRKVRSMAEKEAAGARPYWCLWSPTEVEDWAYGPDGQLLWLKTNVASLMNTDPRTAAVKTQVVTLWERAQVTRMTWTDGTKAPSQEVMVNELGAVPFVPVGVPSADPHWFDGVELIQAATMNLENSHNECLASSHYPQLVIPASLIQAIMQLGGKSYDEALEMTRGLRYPIMEPDEAKGISRFIMPDAGSSKNIPDEVTRRVKALFDMVGLALANPDTKMVQSAESKRLDQLDPQAVLRGQAQLLEEAERKLVAMTKQMDPTFTDYQPAYPTSFDTRNLKEDMDAIAAMMGAVELPHGVKKEVARVAVYLLNEIHAIPEKRLQELLDEVDQMEESLGTDLTSGTLDRGQPGAPNDGHQSGPQDTPPGQ